MAWSVRRNEGAGFTMHYAEVPLRSLAEDEVLIKVKYASINYRDMLGAMGNVGIARRFPYYPGVDASGTIVFSRLSNFPVGASVFVAAVPPNTVEPGCWSTYIIAKQSVIRNIPFSLSHLDTMIFGTAGLSAALGVQKIQHILGGIGQGQKFLVTGASGGVGSTAVAMLSSMGCEVDAVSRKNVKDDYLTSIGAARVLHPSSLLLSSAPNLLKEEYVGAVESLGGEMLSCVLKRICKGGVLVSAGLVDSQHVSMTVLPFLMRGVNLVGTGAEIANESAQLEAWKLLDMTISPLQRARIGKVIPSSEIPMALEDINCGTHQGRFIVNFESD